MTEVPRRRLSEQVTKDQIASEEVDGSVRACVRASWWAGGRASERASVGGLWMCGWVGGRWCCRDGDAMELRCSQGQGQAGLEIEVVAPERDRQGVVVGKQAGATAQDRPRRRRRRSADAGEVGLGWNGIGLGARWGGRVKRGSGGGTQSIPRSMQYVAVRCSAVRCAGHGSGSGRWQVAGGG